MENKKTAAASNCQQLVKSGRWWPVARKKIPTLCIIPPFSILLVEIKTPPISPSFYYLRDYLCIKYCWLEI